MNLLLRNKRFSESDCSANFCFFLLRPFHVLLSSGGCGISPLSHSHFMLPPLSLPQWMAMTHAAVYYFIGGEIRIAVQ